MYILGISCYYHDAAATLLKDGLVVAAVEEERFTRQKHDQSFLINAIRFCLAREGITAKDLAFIGFYEKPLVKFERLLFSCLETFPQSFIAFISALPSWLTEKLRIQKTIRKKLKYKGDIIFIPHHLAHAAQFLVSPFDRAAVVTVDGVGEWTTTAWGVGSGNDISLKKEVRFPHSLGLLYSTITAYLGFSVNDAEYKVMGLSAYGNTDPATNEYYQKLRQLIDVKSDGSFHLDMQYFAYHYAKHMPSKKLQQLLGGPVRTAATEITKRHQDIAAAVQLLYEDIFFKILQHVQKITGEDNLVLSGGAIQNSVANGKVFQQTQFKNVWISSNVTDGGTSLGVASYIYHSVLNNSRQPALTTAFSGPAFSSGAVQLFLDNHHISYTTFQDRQQLIDTTITLLLDNQVVGWFQGAMEFGPRALGARSILANPTNPAMQEVLNKKVKRREAFRPFAPVVCAEAAATYFDVPMPLPVAADFMAMVFPVRPEWRQRLPAITHVDGSARVQTLQRQHQPLLYDVIKAFGVASGVSALINTSFNVRGEPIVCTPEDAYRCLMGTEIDYLVMENFLIKRSNNLSHN